MPKRITELPATAVINAKPRKKQYRLSDGKGLYLLVTPSGGKYWRLDYTLHGKRKTYAVGTFPEVSLKDARKERDCAKELVAQGVDPVRHRREVGRKKEAAEKNTFAANAKAWLTVMEKGWAASHTRTVRSRLERDILPGIGDIPIMDITAPEILKVLRKIERRGARETAHRCKTIVSQVFRFAITTGAAERDPAADLRGALETPERRRMAAITDPVKVGELMRAIEGYQGDIITRCALKLSALCFCRPGETRHAEWSEINWIRREWVIPESKMKMRRGHTVPLSGQAIRVLQEIHPLTGDGKYIFPSLRTGERPMSNNTLLAALRRMGFTKEEMTPHGFRSMASTILHENGFNHDIIELQLSHSRKDRVAAVYDRSLRLPERKEMMQWWSDHLDALAAGSLGVDQDQGKIAVLPG